jgi:hypothetical protein
MQCFCQKKCGGKDHLVDVGIDGKIIFEVILEKHCAGLWTGLNGLRTGSGAGFSKHGGEFWGYMKEGNVLNI